MSLLNAFGIQHVPETVEPELFFSTDDEEFVNRFLAESGIGQEQAIVAMQTQSKDNKPNRWREDRFAELADKMVRELGVAVVFTGAQSEVENVERIRRKMSQPSVMSAGRTTILQLAALLRRCRLFVTLDTGSMHVGRAVGVPMIILASAYQAPEIWLPVNNPNCLILRKGDIPCALCYNDFCSTMECMDAISAAEVFDAVHRRLKKHVFR
jgi:ADP-heptose:LPS heptosyltransferase